MKRTKHKKEQKIQETRADQPLKEETSNDGITEVESIQDFIELKRLQNRILGKLIDQISQADNSEKTNNK